jgi:hypothetical protein
MMKNIIKQSNLPRLSWFVLCCSIGLASFSSNADIDGVVKKQGLFEIYKENRSQGIPNYITKDLLLVSYSMVRNRVMKEVEIKQALPALKAVINNLGASLKKEKKSEATSLNKSYITVLAALTSGVNKIEAKGVDKKAQAELALILGAKGIAKSPLWGIKLDYSQFKPRGYYTSSPELSYYFQAIKYAGSVWFPVVASKATGVSDKQADLAMSQAIQLALLIQGNKDAQVHYKKLNELFGWQVGQSEDISNELLLKIAGAQPTMDAICRQTLLKNAKSAGQQPSIFSMTYDRSKLEKGLTIKDALTGWRLIPQRYTTESAVFQQLVSAQTGKYTGKGKDFPFSAGVVNGSVVKVFPTINEYISLLGGGDSEKLVVAAKDNLFEGYNKSKEASVVLIKGTEGLAAEQVTLIQALLSLPKNKISHEESARVFWTWQRYINLLYANQSYTSVGKSLSFNPQRKHATLEKALPVYHALLSIVKSHQKNTPHKLWDELAVLMSKVVDVAKNNTAGKVLTTENIAFLNRLDSSLLEITGGMDKPIVVDVHTNPSSGEVLEEATGLPVLEFIDIGNDKKARGGRLTHCEFKQPMSNRLNVNTWRKQLNDKTSCLGRRIILDVDTKK